MIYVTNFHLICLSYLVILCTSESKKLRERLPASLQEEFYLS